MKVEWATKGQTGQTLQVPQMPASNTAMQNQNPVPKPCTPNPQMMALDDRAMAISYL